MIHRLVKCLRELLPDRRASAATFLAFAIIPLIGVIGMATDSSRAFLVKSRLSSALDAAALAGGRSFFKVTRDAEINMFFEANFPNGYMDATVTGPVIAIDPEAQKLTLSAAASVPTSFMRLLGFETLNVEGFSEVTRQMQALDVVMAIDMSGSMGSKTNGVKRITAARNAANDLIDILFGNSSTKDLLNIGLVPWNGKVNVMLDGQLYNSGATTTEAVASFTNPETGVSQSQIFKANNSPVPLLEAPPPNWKGCVFNRYLHDGIDDNDADVFDPPVPLMNGEWEAWQPIGPEGEPVSGGVCAMSPGSSECTRCLSHGITPLQQDKATIQAAVNALQNPTGVTNIPAGLGWGWRVLTPDTPFTQAEADPDYNLQRAIVLLTDGANVGGYGDGYKAAFGTGAGARTEMNERLLELANNIKASGVIIYVVQFAYQDSDLQTLLQQVASGPISPYYYYAPDADALTAVFHEVANDLSELRLSK
ncbi:VWA domain-containing protein [Magnetospira sp. QH-2]|uniref:vWA domain-containing protein n=1 Tax=Magnetospira sp. (strain QH-2) TaxID=1288970 RepID=UPI0003E81090|nr:VWA domain-containing protein [Magnetospira sp. QH-2]CCQ73542.1 Conserved protein of unknown function. Containing vWFA (von Willebrand factor, type A) domain [Magnetospira sp. QH-2]